MLTRSHALAGIRAIALGVAAAGCGGKAIIDASDGTGGVGGTTLTTSTSSGPPSALVATITSAQATGGCMPQVPPDPLGVSFTVSYDNSAGSAPGSATIANARVDFSCGPGCSSGLWNFLVTPDTSGTIGAGVSSIVNHDKVPSSGSGNIQNPCDFCGAALMLEVTWDVDGALQDGSFGPFGFGCAF